MNTNLGPVLSAHYLSLYVCTITPQGIHTGPGHWQWSRENMTKGLQE